MDTKRSGLELLPVLVIGVGLGIAAIIVIIVIVDAAPARFDQPVGEAFSALLAVLVLALAIRFLTALFSPTIRASIASHKVVHAICLGAAISIVAFAFLSQRTWHIGAPDQWRIRWLQRPRRDGRTLAQWLRTLATEPSRSGSPLDIIRTHVFTNLHTTVLEVPLSYDLMREHGFFLVVTIDDRGCTVPILRGTNGNCLLPLNWDKEQIPPGLHKLDVGFVIGVSMSASGATQTVVFANEPRSGSPLNIVRMHVDTNLHATILELPLSYDLLRGPQFLNSQGKIVLEIDGHRVHHSISPLRGTNGSCLLVLNWDRERIPPGLHKVQVQLWIGDYLFTKGPARAITFDDNRTSH